jgi:O-antigen/teichoic acid export membrane protein
MAHPVAPAWASTRHTLVGSVRVFLAESLLIPSGLLTAAYLARRLGPEGYGLFTVAAGLVAWVEWSLTALFSRASVKFVADAADWRPIGATILRVHLAASVAVALLLWLLATPLAAFLGEPTVAAYLRLFALDIPLFSLAQAHRNILIGVGKYTERALAAAARWVSRLILVVVLVELGLSVQGAIWGSIGASLIELVVVRVFVRPALSGPATLQMRKLLGYAAPLLLSALALRFFDKLDLIALTALGGTAEQAGHYGAAQNLSILPGLVALSFSPVLLSALSRALREGDHRFARGLSRDAMRGVVLLVPFAGLVAGSTSEIVRLVFGPAFGPAAPLLSWLTFAALALVQVSVGTAILTAAGRLGLTFALTGPLPLLALSGYVLLIPQLGPPGAALVTTLSATAVALATILAVLLVCQASPPIGSVFRSILLGVAAYSVGAMWPTPGFLVLVKLPLMSIMIVLAFGLLGEFSAVELTALRAVVRRQALTG